MNEMSLNGKTGEERCKPSIGWLSKWMVMANWIRG